MLTLSHYFTLFWGERETPRLFTQIYKMKFDWKQMGIFHLCSVLCQGHLYVGTELEVQRIPLADCGRYGVSCRECILSRDPYCAWDMVKKKCTAIPAESGYIFDHEHMK